MRRQWYLGLGIVLVALFLVLVMLHDMRWFFIFLAPMICVWVYDLIQKKTNYT